MKPNVLIFCVDEMCADHLECAGKSNNVHLKRFLLSGLLAILTGHAPVVGFLVALLYSAKQRNLFF
jgi:hypothetical protein